MEYVYRDPARAAGTIPASTRKAVEKTLLVSPEVKAVLDKQKNRITELEKQLQLTSDQSNAELEAHKKTKRRLESEQDRAGNLQKDLTVLRAELSEVRAKQTTAVQDSEDVRSELQKKLTLTRKEKTEALKEIRALQKVNRQLASDVQAHQVHAETLAEQYEAKEEQCRALAEQVAEKEARIIQLEKMHQVREAQACLTVSVNGIGLAESLAAGTPGEVTALLSRALTMIGDSMRHPQLAQVVAK